MTEEEWLACADREQMLRSIQDRISIRKLRLFGAACCRRIWNGLAYEVNRTGVIVAEKFADSMATEDEVQQANDAIDASGDTRHSPADYLTSLDPTVVRQVAQAAAWSVAYNAPVDATGSRIPSWDYWEETESREQISLLRCIFGNPFRPVAFDPRWRTEDVLGLARGIYEERAFDRLPLLADALMDAGCAGEQVIGHCRGEGPHVRGCWVVDLILGKE